MPDTKIGSASAHTLERALEVDRALREFYASRASELGDDRAGLYAHYRARLGAGALLKSHDLAIIGLVVEHLMPYASYAVLRAGLGEIAFSLASLGKRVIAFDPFQDRFEAMLAAKHQLEIASLLKEGRLDAINLAVPQFPPNTPRPILGIAVNYLLRESDKSDISTAYAGICACESLLMSPRLFLHMRDTQSEQREALEQLVQKGYRIAHEYPEVGLVYLRKDEEKRSRTKAAKGGKRGGLGTLNKAGSAIRRMLGRTGRDK